LAKNGFISKTALEESVDKMALLRHDLEEEKQSAEVENKTRRDAIAQMQGAIENLQSGMKVVNTTIDALKVRAPVAGRLTNFNLQVGETVKPDERTGRIDDPEKYKLSALVDEFYLNRVAVGVQGKAHIDNDDYALSVSRIYPQIKDGRFTVELTFTAKQPAGIHPGQRLDAQITLGTPSPALLLPNAAFINDSGGAWVFVVNPDGESAERRPIRVGRRNNSQVEITSGLAKGEKVIVSTYALYGTATRLQIAK
jgi:HlyD family secretion protein